MRVRLVCIPEHVWKEDHCNGLDDVSDIRERARLVQQVGVGYSSTEITLCIARDRTRRT